MNKYRLKLLKIVLKYIKYKEDYLYIKSNAFEWKLSLNYFNYNDFN